MTPPTRPARIEVMHERMAEIERAVNLFRDGLAQTNNLDHQAFFAPLLDRIGLIVENERQGIIVAVADDLSIARSALRRLRIPDIDPDLDVTTPSILWLRGERGNLIEALDNALDAAKGLNLEPRLADMDEIQIERCSISGMLVRLDERLRAVQSAVEALQERADVADAEGVLEVSQRKLVNAHLASLTVEVRAARFETSAGSDAGTPLTTDLTALARAVEAMHDIADDLQETVRGLGQWVGASVRTAGIAVAQAAIRSWRGMKALVWSTRRAIARDSIGKGWRTKVPHGAFNQPLPAANYNRIYELIRSVDRFPANGRVILSAMLTDDNANQLLRYRRPPNINEIIEACTLLDLAVVDGDVFYLTSRGKQFAQASSDIRISLFTDLIITRVPLIAFITHELTARGGAPISVRLLRDHLNQEMPPTVARQTFQIARSWGKRAGLFSIDELSIRPVDRS
jgi:hypothetical protein